MWAGMKKKSFRKNYLAYLLWTYSTFCKVFASSNLFKIFTLIQYENSLEKTISFNVTTNFVLEMFSLEYFHQNYHKHEILSPHHSLWLIWEHVVLFLRCVSCSWISKHDTPLAFYETLLCKLLVVQYLSQK